MGTVTRSIFFDTEQAVNYLGLCETHLYYCRKAGILQCITIGKRGVRYTQEQLDALAKLIVEKPHLLRKALRQAKKR